MGYCSETGRCLVRCLVRGGYLKQGVSPSNPTNGRDAHNGGQTDRRDRNDGTKQHFHSQALANQQTEAGTGLACSARGKTFACSARDMTSSNCSGSYGFSKKATAPSSLAISLNPSSLLAVMKTIGMPNSPSPC